MLFSPKNLPAISKGFWSSFKTTSMWKCRMSSTNQGKHLFITLLLDSVISPKSYASFLYMWELKLAFIFNTPWNQDLISPHYTWGHFWHTFSFWWIQYMLQLSRDQLKLEHNHSNEGLLWVLKSYSPPLSLFGQDFIVPFFLMKAVVKRNKKYSNYCVRVIVLIS